MSINTQSSKHHGLVSVLSLVMAFVLIVNLLAGNQVWPLNVARQRQITLSDLVSSETLSDLYEDPRFQTAVLSFAQVAADASRTIAVHTHSDTFQKFSDDMDENLVKLLSIEPSHPAIERRGIFKDIGNLMSQAGAAAIGGGEAGMGGILSSIGNAFGLGDNAAGAGAGGGGGGGIAGLLTKALNGIVGSLAGPAFFLGAGLGGGAASGLQLTTAAQAKAQTEAAAKANGLKPGGISDVAQNLGSGLTSVVIPLLPVGKLQSQLLPSIAPAAFSLAQGIGNATASGLKLTTEQFAPSNTGNGSIAEIAGNIGLGVTLPIASNIDVQQLLNAAMSQAGSLDIGAAAAAAGRGLGSGATVGLGIAKPVNGAPPAMPAAEAGNGVARRQKQGAAPAPSPAPASNINIPQVVEGFTGGLASSFISSADLTRLAQQAGLNGQDMQNMLLQQLPQAVIRAGTGLGKGAAQGLGILNAGIPAGQPTFQPGPTLDVPGVAEDFTFSLSSTFLGSANITAVTGQLGNQGSQLAAQLPAIVQGAGKGLGQGAANGLGLSNTPVPPANPAPALRRRQAQPNPTDPSAIAEGFTRSLAENFLGSANLSNIAGQLGMGGGGLALPDSMSIMQMLAPAAFGLSSGLGQGAAIGLGFQPDSGAPVPSDSSSGALDVGLVTRSFGKGLSQEFLANGTVTKLMATLQSQTGGLGASVSVPKAAEGFARGLIDGAMVGISSVGGIQNLLNGNIPMDQLINSPPPDMGPAQFNDSIGGAATALGRGFGSQGVVLVAGIISTGGVLPATPPAAGTPARRSVLPFATNSTELGSALVIRQAPGGQVGSDITPIASADLISMAGQFGVDAIGCTGVGGFVAIGLGLVYTGTISLDDVPKGLDPQIAARLPKEPIEIMLDGNRFIIKAQELDVNINGHPLVPFAILTALHIVLVILGFFILLPLFITLNAFQRIATLFGKPVGSKSFTWQKRIFFLGYFPLGVLGTVLGFVAKGTGQHLRSTHGIVGTITLAATLASGAIYFLRSKNPKAIEPEVFLPVLQLLKNRPKLTLPLMHALMLGLVLQLSNFALVSGWTDLGSVSFCASEAILSVSTSVGLATFIMLAITSALAVVGVRVWLERRRMETKGEGGKTIYHVEGVEPLSEKNGAGFGAMPAAGPGAEKLQINLGSRFSN
ncbi:hypothetical protein S7711_04500 [Stachybotrys chartarum IBT 7711]|uniref:Cytochrome b561 domain-containing protein n=1 Tax=Stachybotrys chartarum (strain CBS 109288 / IBT 7711) TaxID=1280523 RepID=A0A084BA85_STACB|nr:hypothetical protein S7711_04500 [Stachybotrys chartarum IBT 7711]